MKKIFLAIPLMVLFSTVSFAKDVKIREMIAENFPPATPSEALITASKPLDPATLKGFIVIKQGGIAAEKARYFINWDDYDYRGVDIDLNKESDVTTRRDSVYTYLKKGDVMAVTDVKYFGKTIYLKLISPEVYIPEVRAQEKHHSRVTLTLGFKVPSAIYKADDANALMGLMNKWIEPFKSLDSAETYAKQIRDKTPPPVGITAAETAVAEIKKEKVKKAAAPKVEAKEVKPSDDAQKLDELEKKINEAKKQMEEAEKEMQQLKSDRQ